MTRRRGRGHGLLASPTVQTLAVFVAVFVFMQSLVFLFPPLLGLFTLSAPVTLQPWTLITSVYAHASVGHLLANSVVLVLVGLPLEHSTTTLAYHAFFITTGAIAGAANVYAAGLMGGAVSVLGASGAVFAMLGYLLAGNRLSRGALRHLDLSPTVQVAIFAVLAAVVTYATASPGVALIAHFTGLLVGLVAGRAGLLPKRRATPAERPEGI